MMNATVKADPNAIATREPPMVPATQSEDSAVLSMIEQALGSKPYLLGNEFSGADIMMGYALLLMKWFGLIADAYPKSAAYLARLEQRPALQKVLG